MPGAKLRTLVLPSAGPCLISTDLHGNLRDFQRLVEIWRELGPDARWVQLGDLVHGPNAEIRTRYDGLYDFDDHSFEVVDGFSDLVATGRVHFVLGNHDHGHVGGPHTQKFHSDEVLHLESTLQPAQIERMTALFQHALLAVVAPCGLLLTHGAPGDALHSLADLDAVALSDEPDPRRAKMLRSLLTAYGQPADVIERLLSRLSAEVGFSLSVVIHGHDKDEEGWFVENRQLVPVIFGAHQHQKRCVVVDLARQYEGVDDLRDGVELLRLYP